MTSLLVIAALAAAGALGWWVNNRLGRNSLEAARKRAAEVVAAAQREGEKQKRTAILEARDEIFQARAKAERDGETLSSSALFTFAVFHSGGRERSPA